MYSLIAIFALIPLIFSYTFARFGSGFIVDNGIGYFESVKMYLFLILLVIATLEIGYRKWRHLRKIFGQKRSYLSGAIIVILLILGLYLYPHDTFRDLLLGIGEKQHGLLFPIGLIWLGILISSCTQMTLKYISYSIIVSGCIIALIALIESWGYNIFTGASYTNKGSWGDIRSTSTLGNPNYVAGYLLMILPIVYYTIERIEKYWILVLLCLGILMTKSLIGISITLVFLLFLIVRKGLQVKKSIFTVFFFTLLVGSISFILSGESEKWLSLMSRFILMKHTLMAASDSIIGMIFGYGPNAILGFFSDIRPLEIQAYFPNSSIIDSSHNIFIDIFASYGLLGVSLFIGFMVSVWRHLSIVGKAGILLGLAFLSLNVLIVSHMILIVFFSGNKKASHE